MSNTLKRRYLSASAMTPRLDSGELSHPGMIRLVCESIRTGGILWSGPWVADTEQNRELLEDMRLKISQEQFIQNASRTGSFTVRR